jgi:hypothetical protein
MPRCGTCRFFGAESGLISWDDESIDHASGHHNCVRILHGNSGDHPGAIRDLACVTDGSGYAASLKVLPTFGCVLHEAGEHVPKDESE